MIRSNSAPRSSGSIAKRPLVKRELAATPGGWEGVREPMWARLWGQGREEEQEEKGGKGRAQLAGTH